MEFHQFAADLQQRVASMLEGDGRLFVTDVDPDELWELYMDNFPEGTNEIFRERRSHDCSCCRSFIRQFGNVVTIEDDRIQTIWNIETGHPYQQVAEALSERVARATVMDAFVTKQGAFGTEKSHEQLKDGAVHTWHHFRIELPRRLVTRSSKSEAALRGEIRDSRNVLKRSLDEISQEAVETVLDLIAEKSLYKGEEWRGALTKFSELQREYAAHSTSERENYCWTTSLRVGGAISRIRNHSIGVLLQGIADGVDVVTAVHKYEAIVAPQNYKRPKAIFTRKMVEDAQRVITDLGLLDSLGRRFARLPDITINNVLFADRDAARHMDGAGGIFEVLKAEVAINPKQFERVPGVSAEHFVAEILPTATKLEILLENRHQGNLVSLIAPAVSGSPSLFKWDNGFSWAYSGNVADSMKQRVKAAGGNVEGVLRFSLQWNEDGDNPNDFDAHCTEPDGTHIYYPNKGRIHQSSGVLDVDIINPGRKVAVENITWSRLGKMPDGVYRLLVHNYSHHGGVSGFAAEVEFQGQVHEFEYRKELAQGERVTVAKVELKNGQFRITESLPSTLSPRTVWGLSTNQFHTVSACMFSPNYWDGQSGVGHRHYFFMLAGCENDERPNGFFNEYLREQFMPHRRVFAALGSKMKVERSDDQLSGLGFSSTKRNSVVCRINKQHAVKVVL